MSSYLYDSMADCVKAKAHSTDVDDDGFCNHCGHEPLNEEGEPSVGDVCRHGEVWKFRQEHLLGSITYKVVEIDCDVCDVCKYFEWAKTEYGPRLAKLLENTRTCLTKHGWTAGQVIETADDDLEYRFTASREPDDIEECAVDFYAQMCLSEDYEGVRGGVTFRVDVTRVGGTCITNASPENYGPKVWVPRDDKEAVSKRLQILEKLKPESILPLINK